MKGTWISYLILLAAVPAHAGDVYLMTDFNQGIPADFTLISNDNMSIASQDFKRIQPTKTWFSSEANGADGLVAMSASRRQYADIPTDNWIITPRLHITSTDAWLRWDARSIHHDLRDGYTVLISTTDLTGLKPVVSIREETYSWATHVVSLADYVGKDVYIAVSHNSTNRFLLALDNLFVGELDDISIRGRNTSRHFVGDEGKMNVTGIITNTGRSLNLKEISLDNGKGQTYTMPYASTLSTGDTLNYEIEMPVTVGQKYDYTVKVIETNGTEHEVVKDAVACSYYPRTMLIEKFTGLWCNYCPAAEPLLYGIEERFGKEAAIIEVHGYKKSLDIMSNDAYIRSLNVKNFPTVIYNRDMETMQNSQWASDAYINYEMSLPTEAMVAAKAEWTNDGKIKATTTIQFANTIDNSTGKYRVGYLLKEKRIDGTTIQGAQLNNCTVLENEEFRYLPTSISGYLIDYNNVARGGETDEGFAAMGGISGIRGNLPAAIEAKHDYVVTTTLDVPGTISDKNNLELVAILFKSTSVVNASAVDKIDNNTSTINSHTVQSAIQLHANSNGSYTALMPNDGEYTVKVARLDGTLVEIRQGQGTECLITSDGKILPGCYIVHITQKKHALTTKIVINQ